MLVAGLALAVLFVARPAQAQIIGHFDYVDVAMVDYAYGWICDQANPYANPAGTLAVYSGGSYYFDAPLVSGYWGFPRPDVPQAGLCGGNAAVGWGLVGWFASPVHIYYRHPNGWLQELGGSPKWCTGPGLCY
jgi:hypothetical protein